MANSRYCLTRRTFNNRDRLSDFKKCQKVNSVKFADKVCFSEIGQGQT